jgi:hypothetical protein
MKYPQYFSSFSGMGRDLTRLLLILSALFLLATMSGCASTTARTATQAPTVVKSGSVLLMPIDIELSELTAGGLQEPRADWTETAQVHVRKALDETLLERNSSVQLYQEPAGDPALLHDCQQMQKLYNAVGLSILMHAYNPMFALPSKKDEFDWTLGPGVQKLAADSGADYVMFVYIRDSYATAGRKLAMFAMAALGVGIQGGLQVGFTSLVDARTGDIVWFNRLISTTGDLRTEEPARLATTTLLTDFPL